MLGLKRKKKVGKERGEVRAELQLTTSWVYEYNTVSLGSHETASIVRVN